MSGSILKSGIKCLHQFGGYHLIAVVLAYSDYSEYAVSLRLECIHVYNQLLTTY